MQTIDNQPTQSVSPQLVDNQPVETKKSSSLTRRQLIGIGLVGGLILLFIFGLGVRAGEKRALRKQIMPQSQPTPTNVQPSPVAPSPLSTPVQPSLEITPPPTPTTPPIQRTQPTPPPESSEKSDEDGGPVNPKDSEGNEGESCWKCIEQGDEEVCDLGTWQNGVCVW